MKRLNRREKETEPKKTKCASTDESNKKGQQHEGSADNDRVQGKKKNQLPITVLFLVVSFIS